MTAVLKNTLEEKLSLLITLAATLVLYYMAFGWMLQF